MFPKARAIVGVMQATDPVTPATASSDHDDRIRLHAVGWEDFERLLAMRGERGGVRIAYLAGEVELMSPSRSHERISHMIGRLLSAYAEERGLELCGYGAWTVKEKEDERGLEPDQCFVLGSHEAERPDLAIEVVWTSGGLDKLEIYRGLKVGEVWYWKDGRISVHVLEAGAYREQARSRLLPGIDLGAIASLATRTDQTTAVREYRAALRPRQG